MRLAQIEGGIVINAAEVDPGSVPDFMADWPELPEDVGIGWAWDGETYTAPAGPPPEQLLTEAKAAARSQLLAAIVEARSALITQLPGQDMIYLAKEAEAKAWIADPVPNPADYPLLSAEVGITAPDAESLVQVWLNMAVLWRGAAAQLEPLRLSVSAGIDAASTAEEVTAALELLTVLEGAA